MRYLLDSHALIWYLEDSPNLPSTARSMVDDAENTVHICTISLWEIAIKVNLGKLKLNWTFNEFLRSVEMSDFSVLHIENKHLQKLADIPFLHKDPFDRLLISTALVENLTVITVDDCIRKYDVSWVW